MLEQSSLQEIAKATIEHVHNLIKFSNTTRAFFESSLIEQIDTCEKVSALREAYVEKSAHDATLTKFQHLELDKVIVRIEKFIAFVKSTSTGNCSEACLLALEYIFKNYPDIRVEYYEIKGGDHNVLVLNQPRNNEDAAQQSAVTESVKDDDPMTWGDAWICDVLYQSAYPAKSYLNNLKTFQAHPENGETDEHFEDFDPTKHQLCPVKDHNSDYLRGLNQPNKILRLRLYFTVKIVILKKFIQVLREKFVQIEPNIEIGSAQHVTLKNLRKKAELQAMALKNPLQRVADLATQVDSSHPHYYWNLRQAMQSQLASLLEGFLSLLPVEEEPSDSVSDSSNNALMCASIKGSFFCNPTPLKRSFTDIYMPGKTVRQLFNAIIDQRYDTAVVETVIKKQKMLDLRTIDPEIDGYIRQVISSQQRILGYS